jgi:hypothetical protein
MMLSSFYRPHIPLDISSLGGNKGQLVYAYELQTCLAYMEFNAELFMELHTQHILVPFRLRQYQKSHIKSMAVCEKPEKKTQVPVKSILLYVHIQRLNSKKNVVYGTLCQSRP